jgi:hypothetical protein
MKGGHLTLDPVGGIVEEGPNPGSGPVTPPSEKSPEPVKPESPVKSPVESPVESPDASTWGGAGEHPITPPAIAEETEEGLRTEFNKICSEGTKKIIEWNTNPVNRGHAICNQVVEQDGVRILDPNLIHADNVHICENTEPIRLGDSV